MANVYKSIGDFSQVKTNLNESIAITSSVVLGYSNNNWKTYSHGMFTSVYDYPYLSSSANQLYDITAAVRSGSNVTFVPTSSTQYRDQKFNLYTEYEQVLTGYNASGSLIPLNTSGSLTPTSGEYIEYPIFLNFSRLLTKDEIKKGTFSVVLDITGGYTTVLTNPNQLVTLSDFGATGSNPAFLNNSPAGEYAILYSGSATTGSERGLIFYQAGIAVIDGYKMFGSISPMQYSSGSAGYRDYLGTVKDATLDQFNSGSIRRISSISFNNTTELNSTVYFCRLGFNDFNFSSNPSYLSSSQIIVKNNNAENDPASYVTTIGLYSPSNELLAVAKLSQPVKKTPAEEITFRVRLDY
jgi:hypothetical protein